ncbi:MAG: tRNA (adenosine(37)-N6)-threonylcarbamoyltransferase complex dimerization subunit type 1 TsaB [Bacillota bacterium]
MNFLALDTTMDSIAIALSYNNKAITKTVNEGKKRHNSQLLPAVEEILFENGIDLSDIDAFGVVVGPGSFTGIRVGVATINAMSFALKKPVVEMTSLELVRTKYPLEDILSLIYCLNDNYYGGYFKDDKVEYFAITKNELDTMPQKKVFIETCDPVLLFDTMKQKCKKKSFVSRAKPFYLKKSSAERENEK